MALQGEAKKLYHREYTRCQPAGLPTRGVVKPKVMEQWCSERAPAPNPQWIVVSLASGYRLCAVLLRSGRSFVRRGARHARAMRERRTPSWTPSTLLELDGTDLRRIRPQVRKATLASILRKPPRRPPERAPSSTRRRRRVPASCALGC